MSVSAARKSDGPPPEILRAAEQVARDAVPWRPDMPYARRLCLRADSYQAWADAAVPEAAGLRPAPPRPRDLDHVRVGDFVLYRRSLPRYAEVLAFIWWRAFVSWELCGLPLHRHGRPYGVVHFDGDVSIPVLADADLDPWMSPTPAEAMSQRPGIRAARGRVLVAGLGLGWLAKEVRRKKGVRSVTVVEKDADVARFFGEGFRRSDGAEASVRVDDFYSTPLDGFDSIIADIWRESGDAHWDERFQQLKRDRPGVRVWGWGDYVPRT